MRQWRRSLSAIALLLALGQAPALAATIAVAPGIPPAINADGICALIEAIDNANADAQTHSDCVAGNGADTIVLPTKSTQSLTAVDNDITVGPTGLPVISSTVTIRGRNSTIQRESSAPPFRILAVASSGDLTLHSTTVSGGRSEGYPLPGGGGVFNSGMLTLTNSTVSGNSVDFGVGGGVFNSGTTLTNSTVSGNFVRYFGGGGVFSSGMLTLTNSTVSGNSAFGGGVYNTGTLTVTRALISGNTAPFYNDPSEVAIGGTAATIVANNHNLFGHDGDAGVVGFSPGSTDLVPSEDLSAILNATLADNGGPTRTHALIAGSPAIDASGRC